MKNNYLYITYALIMGIFAASCSNDSSFDNRGYLTPGTQKVQSLFIKPNIVNETKTLEVSIAKPEDRDITFTLAADPSAVATYNTIYGADAVLLPEVNYAIDEPELTVVSGTVKSDPINIDFKDINTLDRDMLYVLPVKISSPNIGLLESARTTYYLFKGAALINVVADIEKNYLKPAWANPSVANNLTTLTLEALINAKDFNNGEISSVMGIEGSFLIRLGDANFERNQIQLATSNGNFPGRDSSKGLPTNQWVHVAVTFDAGAVQIFIDGQLQSEGRVGLSSVNLGIGGKDGFYIGRSYNDDRWLNGFISECRIWNKVRTQEEIAATIYGVAPDTEGLVSYWKFDEGEGNTVKDHTANGNDLTSAVDLKWNEVSLPATSDK